MTKKTKERPSEGEGGKLRLTAARKWELYLATRSADAPIGELLRTYHVHLEDLREIETTVESAVLAGLKVKGRHGRAIPEQFVTAERVAQLEHELAEKTEALAELSMSYTLLKKKEREESQARNAQASVSHRKRGQ